MIGRGARSCLPFATKPCFGIRGVRFVDLGRRFHLSFKQRERFKLTRRTLRTPKRVALLARWPKRSIARPEVSPAQQAGFLVCFSVFYSTYFCRAAGQPGLDSSPFSRGRQEVCQLRNRNAGFASPPWRQGRQRSLDVSTTRAPPNFKAAPRQCGKRFPFRPETKLNGLEPPKIQKGDLKELKIISVFFLTNSEKTH